MYDINRMRYSQLFAKTLREVPRDADAVNHRLLVQAGYVRQVMAGVYTYLPLGLRVLNNISQIVRQEMDAIGGQEVLMPSLHPATLWKQTGGWEGIDVLFKLKSRTNKEYALAQSHEETVTPLAAEWLHSYKDLPLVIYHIAWKFRDELRSKSGILRGREFLMKDMYSWHIDQADFDAYYARVKQAYLKVFGRLGLVAKVTEASGGAFTTKVSYEFEVLTDAGEANILYCDTCEFCVNTDDFTNYKEGDSCPKCGRSSLLPARASEVGNVFDLGQKYSQAFDLTVTDKKGKKIYPMMGCYGIGISRTMGTLVEKFHDGKGIIWPEAVAPFQAHLIDLSTQRKEKSAQIVYEKLVGAKIDVLWDETDRSAGEKFARADLIGIPVRLVISDKTGDKVEWKKRSSDKTELLTVEEVMRQLKAE